MYANILKLHLDIEKHKRILVLEPPEEGLSVWHGSTPDRHLKASSGKHKAIKMQMQHNPCVSGKPDPPGLEYLLMMSVCQPLWQEECMEEKERGGVWVCVSVRERINGRRWEKRCDRVFLGLFTQLCFLVKPKYFCYVHPYVYMTTAIFFLTQKPVLTCASFINTQNPSENAHVQFVQLLSTVFLSMCE